MDIDRIAATGAQAAETKPLTADQKEALAKLHDAATKFEGEECCRQKW